MTAFVEVRGLVKHFPIRKGILKLASGDAVHAVNGIDFEIPRGTTLGLVGESGCGKSTTARMLVRLLRPTAGEVKIGGVDLATLNGAELRRARHDCQIVFQDPFGSLDPRMNVADLIGEPIRVATDLSRAERLRRVSDLLDKVGLPADSAERHPHEFSGGQRQRIGIARALALSPKFVVCDEPVSALDVSIQAQIVNLLKDLQDELELTYLFVSHDLAIVSQIADVVAVMYLGKIVEMADVRTLFNDPKHPYTKKLLDAVPRADPSRRGVRGTLGGELPSPINLPSGCSFHPRCPIAVPACSAAESDLLDATPGHRVACHLVHDPAYGTTTTANAS